MTPRGWLLRASLGFGALILACSAVIVIQPLWAFDALAWLMPHVVWRIETSQPLVALSFDDGPSLRYTPRVLEILARHGAQATFFLIGDRAVAYPGLVQRLRAEGHEIGNHAYTIGSLLDADDEAFLENLLRTEQILRIQGPLKLFRPPGGKIRSAQVRLAEDRGYRVVLGSAHPYDGARPPSAYMRWLVTKNLAPGVVVILHDGIADPSRMLAALDSILRAGERRGLRFVTVGELLRAGGD